MDDYRQHVFELLDRAEQASYAPRTGSMLAEAFRVAEKHNDLPMALLARYLYTFAVAPIEPEKALVSFAWCVSHEEHAGGLVSKGSIAQLYGIAVGILRSYPDYSLEQIEQTYQEMEQKFDELGLPRRDLLHHRIYGMLALGRRDVAEEYYGEWLRTTPGPDDCPVCDRGTRVLFNLNREDYEVGLAYAEPILEGEIVCGDGQPLLTQAAVLVPLIRLGRLDEAGTHYRRSLRHMDTISYAGIWAAGRQLSYLALAASLDDAVETFERFFPIAFGSGTPVDRFGFYVASTLLMRRFAEKGEDAAIAFPTDFPLYREDGSYEPDALHDWLHHEVQELADAFDRRNGNGEYNRIMGVFEDIYEDVRSDL